jgi:hypothetical protein
MQAAQPVASTLDEMDAMNAAGGGSAPPPTEHNVEAILSEISFVTDFIKYQERSNLEAILIMGSVQAGFAERLATGLDIPVYATEDWVRPGIVDSASGGPGVYLDTYAAGLPSSIIGFQHMLNMKTEAIIRNPKARLTAIASGLAIGIFTALAFGIFIPYIMEQALRLEYRRMDARADYVSNVVYYAPSPEEIDGLLVDIDFIETRVDGIDDFYAEFAQAAVVVPIIFEAGFSHIEEISAVEDRVIIHGWAIYFNHVADLLEDFRNHELFRASGVLDIVEEFDTTDNYYGTTEFEAVIFQERRAGALDE